MPPKEVFVCLFTISRLFFFFKLFFRWKHCTLLCPSLVSVGGDEGCPLFRLSHLLFIAQLVKNPPAVQETRFNSWVRKICWRRDRLPTPVSLGFPHGLAGKESACRVGDLGSIPGLGRSPGKGKVYPLQYSGLENSMDYIVHGVTKNRTQLSDFHFHLPFIQYLKVKHFHLSPYFSL